MKNNFKDRLKEFINFLICLVFLLAIAYYTGFLKEFSPDDFSYAYKKFISNISKNSLSSNDRAKILSSGNSTSRKASSYEQYRLLTIPQTVIDGAYESNSWLDVFNADRKVIFYLYDPSGQNPNLSVDFHNKIQHYIQSSEMRHYYKVVAYADSAFKNFNVGMIGIKEKQL